MKAIEVKQAEEFERIVRKSRSMDRVGGWSIPAEHKHTNKLTGYHEKVPAAMLPSVAQRSFIVRVCGNC